MNEIVLSLNVFISCFLVSVFWPFCILLQYLVLLFEAGKGGVFFIYMNDEMKCQCW